ncbi:MAG: sulfotransferase [Desulfobacterales bacterium]|nr:sulfotransferase [Desulfobacterales bacterium]
MTACKPILVTGLVRSGTTWVGDMIASAPRVVYMQEPFNPQYLTAFSATTISHRLKYICKANENTHYNDIRQILDFKIPFKKIFNIAKKPLFIPAFLKDYSVFKFRNHSYHRPLMKDPMAFFSAEWLADRFDADVIITIRHPAAFVGSMKVKQWKYGIRRILKQSLLIEHHLGIFEHEMKSLIKNHKNDYIGLALLGWKIFYHMLSKYERNHPEWLFIRHEDLSADPINGYRDIYQKLGLEFTDRAKRRILEFSSAANPVEQHNGHKLKRDSRSNISTWKSRLTAGEIERVKKETFDLAQKYYSDSDW